MTKESDKHFPNFDLMSAFGLETEGDSQSQNQQKSKTTKENNSKDKEGPVKKRRFAVVERQDLDTLVEDSLAKKTKQATQCFTLDVVMGLKARETSGNQASGLRQMQRDANLS